MANVKINFIYARARYIVKNIEKKLYNIISSNYFFTAVTALFILQAIWFAISINISVNVDEQIHYAIANIYSNFITPIGHVQDQAWDSLGIVANNQSYLSYYILGKFLNIINIFTDTESHKIVLLRLINISFFIASLLLLKRIFGMLGFSKAIQNITILSLTIIPNFIYWSAFISYDNLQFFVTTIFVYTSICIINKQKLDIIQFALLIAVGSLGSLIKSTFVPIFITGVITVVIIKFIQNKKTIYTYIKQGVSHANIFKRIMFGLLILLSFTMLSEQYLLDKVNYGNFMPSCEAQLSLERCRKNLVYDRNYNWLQTKEFRMYVTDPIKHLGEWSSLSISAMYGASFFIGVNPLNSFPIVVVHSPLNENYNITRSLIVISFITMLIYLRKILTRYDRQFVFILSVIYMVVLFIYNYSESLKYAYVAAASGRYWLPVLPYLILFMVSGAVYTLRFLNVSRIYSAVIIVFILFSTGTGSVVYYKNIKDEYIWNNQFIIESNHKINKIYNNLYK